MRRTADCASWAYQRRRWCRRGQRRSCQAADQRPARENATCRQAAPGSLVRVGHHDASPPLQSVQAHRLGSRNSTVLPSNHSWINIRSTFSSFMSYYGDCMWTFSVFLRPQGVDSVLPGNSPARGAAARESPAYPHVAHRFVARLHRSSTDLCTEKAGMPGADGEIARQQATGNVGGGRSHPTISPEDHLL